MKVVVRPPTPYRIGKLPPAPGPPQPAVEESRGGGCVPSPCPLATRPRRRSFLDLATEATTTAACVRSPLELSRPSAARGASASRSMRVDAHRVLFPAPRRAAAARDRRRMMACIVLCWLAYTRKRRRPRPRSAAARPPVRRQRSLRRGGDGGWFGAGGGACVQVLASLCALKLAHPADVQLQRGNHEDRTISESYGFRDGRCCRPSAVAWSLRGVWPRNL